MRTATTAPAAKRTSEAQHTRANLFSCPIAANAVCVYASLEPRLFFFLPALIFLAFSLNVTLGVVSLIRSSVICCGVRLRKQTIATMSNKEEVIGKITSNQLPSPEILKEHPAEHRTASASF